MLMATAWLVLTGAQVVRSIGDLARFGNILFQILAPLQLALAVFFAALFTASSVSQEKERRTFLLLLMTDLSNTELVLGKLFSSLLNVFVLLVSAIPLFVGLMLLGGVAAGQICTVLAVTACGIVAAGSLGSTVALWREKAFQAIALTVLALVFWIGIWEIAAQTSTGKLLGVTYRNWATIFSPWQAILEGARPNENSFGNFWGSSSLHVLFCPAALGIALVLNIIAIVRVRVWNPSREVRRKRQRADTPECVFESNAVRDESPNVGRHVSNSTPASPAVANSQLANQRYREVWSQPILWREICTWAYGRKVLIVRFVYLAFSLAALLVVFNTADNVYVAAIPLFLISLILINAQAVTSLAGERDAKTLDLLLVTDLSAKEFVFGKLGGVLYNSKEMIIAPVVFCGILWARDIISLENSLYLIGGLIVMTSFVAMLGIHCGLIHHNSRVAIATSLGTVFFLFVGVAACIRIMVAFSGSFGYQLAPFLAFMIGGGSGLYVLLGGRHASTAIFCAAFTIPFLTFWAITSLLQEYTLGPFLVISASYTFATLTMLIPAISEFEFATGRATNE